MMDVPEKEAYKVMQTKALLHSFTLSSCAGQSVGRWAHRPTSNLFGLDSCLQAVLPNCISKHYLDTAQL